MTAVNILGVSGSIGRQTLDVCARLAQEQPGAFSVTAMSAGRDWQFLAQAARQFRPALVALSEPTHCRELTDALADLPIQVVCGPDASEQAAAWPEGEICLAAVSGLACLAPLVAALRSGKTVALANKEALVSAGALVTALAHDQGVALRPVDSEHSALWQCLRGEAAATVSRLILTASGGPFRTAPPCLDDVTPEQALAHPSWRMGPKITVDSATMVNKGLEIIEAHWLFGMDYSRISVLVHPESIVHSLVEYADGSQKALLSQADMRLPIQYALTGEQRRTSPLAPLDLGGVGSLSFYHPDEERFPALRIIREAGQVGGLLPAYLNGANEALVALFLEKKLRFTGISRILERLLYRGCPGTADTLAAVYAADAAGRRDATALAV